MEIFARLPFDLQNKVMMMRPRHPVASIVKRCHEDEVIELITEDYDLIGFMLDEFDRFVQWRPVLNHIRAYSPEINEAMAEIGLLIRYVGSDAYYDAFYEEIDNQMKHILQLIINLLTTDLKYAASLEEFHNANNIAFIDNLDCGLFVQCCYMIFEDRFSLFLA